MLQYTQNAKTVVLGEVDVLGFPDDCLGCNQGVLKHESGQVRMLQRRRP